VKDERKKRGGLFIRLFDDITTIILRIHSLDRNEDETTNGGKSFMALLQVRT
jgi:hypothetical protein